MRLLDLLLLRVSVFNVLGAMILPEDCRRRVEGRSTSPAKDKPVLCTMMEDSLAVGLMVSEAEIAGQAKHSLAAPARDSRGSAGK